jgi:polyphosphate kinase
LSTVKAKEKAGRERYLNRELSWLKFDERVLHEAADPKIPLLERLKFLAIFESNLDEFYMVRVSGLIEQFESGILEESPDGLTPTEQLATIARAAHPLRVKAGELFERTLRPELEAAGIVLRAVADLPERPQKELKRYFGREIFPLLTPLILHPAHTVPFISNRSLNLAVELAETGVEARLARVKVPTVVPRAVLVPGTRHEFVLLEDLISRNLEALFPGVEIVGSHAFRVIRDADVEIRELEAADLIASIEETLRLRRFGDPVLLQCEDAMPPRVRKALAAMLELEREDVFSLPGVLGLEFLYEIAKLDKPSLRYPPYLPHVPEALSQHETLFETIAASDVLVHHPFDGFRPVEELAAAAVNDPAVIGIKQTLYRVGSESPVVEKLLDAAEEGKQVAAMVELKARFDESNNLVWARALERAGVHVTYGFPEMKTHCKLCLVVRREGKRVRQYAHIGTGNYNPETARIYTDLGLFTDDEAITQDIAELFNYLTGFSRQTEYRKLLVAPVNLREGIVARIRREGVNRKKGKPARIVVKLNSLVDPEVIDALYAASDAGVRIDLIVRGVCCLRPGVAGLSENIGVMSIIGRFLEHSRIYYFENGGTPDVLIGSADAMRRNLDRRIEVLAPVEDPTLAAHLRDHILENCLRDNVKSWDLAEDGTYRRRKPKAGQKPFDAQAFFMANPSTKLLLG